MDEQLIRKRKRQAVLVFGGMAVPFFAFLIVIAVVLIKTGAGGFAVIPFLFMIPAAIVLAFTIKKAFRNVENGCGFKTVPNGADTLQEMMRQQEAIRQHQEMVRQHQEFVDQTNQQIVDQMNQQTINQNVNGF